MDMYWACFLHFYQPPTQKKYWVDRITKEAYRPIMLKLLENPSAKLTINIAAVLLELWEKYDYQDVIAGYRKLLERGQIELTGSAKFHPLLPKIPDEEIIRQIHLNEETLKHYFPSLQKLKGFFPPEMAYEARVAKIVASLGYEWIIAEELSFSQENGKVNYSKIYEVEGAVKPDGALLKIFFRERGFSYKVLSGQLGTVNLFLNDLGDRVNRKNYLLTAMDGETFGHHRPGMERLLADLFSTPGVEMTKISELPDIFKDREATKTYPSTWALMEKDVTKNIPFSRWDDPENEIHQLQWQLTSLAIKTVTAGFPPAAEPCDFSKVAEVNSAVTSSMQKASLEARLLLDRAIHSDQYWWASARPWWSLEMIERGAKELKDSVYLCPNATEANKKKAEELYLKIIVTGFDWQRSGKVDELSHKEDEEVRMRTDEGLPKLPKVEVEKMVANLKKEMEEVARSEEFERAALLRDRIKELREYTD